MGNSSCEPSHDSSPFPSLSPFPSFTLRSHFALQDPDLLELFGAGIIDEEAIGGRRWRLLREVWLLENNSWNDHYRYVSNSVCLFVSLE